MSLISGAIHQHAKDCCVVQKNGFFKYLPPFWPPSVQSENDQTGTPMFVFVTIPGGITIIMPTIIIIHSSKYSVLFRFISSRCTWIRYSDVQYFPIHVLSMYIFFFKMYIHVSSDRLQTYFPSYPCPFERTNYCSFQIYRIEYHPIPAFEGGDIIIFNIFFWPNVWCFLHWYHTSSTIEDI